MKLTEKAMLVYLSISQWTAKRVDKKATAELCTTHNSNSQWMRGQKNLVAESEIAKISKIANKIRTFHNLNTLTWDRNGGGLLPNTNYFEYTSQLSTLKNEFDEAVKAFIVEYPTLQANAAAHLNGLYNAADYPNVNEISARFCVNINFIPVPDSADFRCELQDGEAAKIKASIEEHTAEQLQDAVKDLWERLQTTVKAAKDKLSDKEAIFRDSLIENIKDVCKIIPRLNVTGDAKLEEISREALAKLTTDPEILRNNETSRAQAATAADQILAKMAAYV